MGVVGRPGVLVVGRAMLRTMPPAVVYSSTNRGMVVAVPVLVDPRNGPTSLMRNTARLPLVNGTGAAVAEGVPAGDAVIDDVAADEPVGVLVEVRVVDGVREGDAEFVGVPDDDAVPEGVPDSDGEGVVVGIDVAV